MTGGPAAGLPGAQAGTDQAMTESSEPRPDMAPGDEAPPQAPETAENVCPQCQGSGREGDGDCPACGGTGTVAEAVGGG